MVMENYVTGRVIPSGSLLQMYVYKPSTSYGNEVTPAPSGVSGYYYTPHQPVARIFDEDTLLYFVGHAFAGYFGGKFDGIAFWKEKFYVIVCSDWNVVSLGS